MSIKNWVLTNPEIRDILYLRLSLLFQSMHSIQKFKQNLYSFLYFNILDNSGNIVVKYEYDSWGNHIVKKRGWNDKQFRGLHWQSEPHSL